MQCRAHDVAVVPDRQRCRGTRQSVGEQSPRVGLVQDDEIGARPAQLRDEVGGNVHRPDGAHRSDTGDLGLSRRVAAPRAIRDLLAHGGAAGVGDQDAALDQAGAHQTQRLEHPFHAARYRRIEFADVQNALHTSTRSIGGRDVAPPALPWPLIKPLASRW